MILRLLILISLICSVNLGGAKAYADETRLHPVFSFRPELRCSEDESVFIIQFGLFTEAGVRKSYTNSIMPISRLWPNLTPAEDGACQLKNSSPIQLTADGDYKNGKFSLRIGDHYIYSDTAFFSENDEAVYDLRTMIVFQDGRLTECRQVKNETHEFAALCNRETRRMHDDVDGDERKRLRRFQVAKDRGIVDRDLSPFCKSLKPLYLKYAEQYKRPPNDFEVDFLKFDEERAFSLDATFTDINDDGETDLIYRMAGYSNSFYGSFLAIFLNRDAFSFDFESDYKTRGSTEDWFKSSKWKDNLFSGGMAGSSVRYVFNRPLRLNGKSYIYTSEYVSKKIPSEILYEIHTDGTKTPACIYP